ncbi:AraC family transcriptional regulator [Chitinophaga silvatica]|uniref:AraC family transcriptional regulator n=1 Tax=Chitinophaga silvatica TaxID=2282649 RepID=A0A3E1Y4H1_9BACT|nr:helix-turn-helix transcriptional regulator [Chitinophaga silvatica]RFS19377.1 AraC family transcriptional regulator [Chitinophaga silvatica]
MKYNEIKPCAELVPYIHSFWELKGTTDDNQWERNFPDGCPGLVINLGESCKTDNGGVELTFGKTYVVGTTTTFKESFINANTHLLGVCLKPGAFSNFYKYHSQHELINCTVEFDNSYSFNINKIINDPVNYLNNFFLNKIENYNRPLQSVIEDIRHTKGQLPISSIAKRNFTTVRQLERNFKTHLGISPKEYSNIIRFQNALSIIKNPINDRRLLDIAFECGYSDHAHLTNEIKRNTGFAPSQL